MGSCRYWAWVTQKKSIMSIFLQQQKLLVLFISDPCLYFPLPWFSRNSLKETKKKTNTPPSPAGVFISPVESVSVMMNSFITSSIRPFVSSCFRENCSLGFISNTTQRYEQGLPSIIQMVLRKAIFQMIQSPSEN